MMSIEVKVPMLPESVADATVLTWHKKAGESVMRDERLVDLETDKVVLEVPAPEDGVLVDILKSDGTTVLANEVLAVINPGSVSATPKAPAESVPAPAAAPELSPAVRRLVAEHNIDVSLLQGTGKGGRIVKEDVESLLKQQASAPARLPQADIPPVMDIVSSRPEKRVPMSRLRAKIAERLVQAQHNASMLTTLNEVNLQTVMELNAK